MLNGKFIATKDWSNIFTRGKVYEFVDGRTIMDGGARSSRYSSLEDFYKVNTSFTGELAPYIEPQQVNLIQQQTTPYEKHPSHSRLVEISKHLGDDDVTMTFTYSDTEEVVKYSVVGGDIDYVPNMINHYVQFLTRLGFSEEIVLKFMKKYIEDSEI